MFKNQLANYERYSKNNASEYVVESSYSVYEVYIELSRDKEGNPLKNKDGSDRYYPIDDSYITKLSEDTIVKKIRDNYFKKIYRVNNENVELTEHDNKHMYFVVNDDKITTLPKDTLVVSKGETYRIPNEIGYVLMDEKDIEHPRILAVRKFETDDHKAEAEQIVKGHHHNKVTPKDK